MKLNAIFLLFPYFYQITKASIEVSFSVYDLQFSESDNTPSSMLWIALENSVSVDN